MATDEMADADESDQLRTSSSRMIVAASLVTNSLSRWLTIILFMPNHRTEDQRGTVAGQVTSQAVRTSHKHPRGVDIGCVLSTLTVGSKRGANNIGNLFAGTNVAVYCFFESRVMLQSATGQPEQSNSIKPILVNVSASNTFRSL